MEYLPSVTALRCLDASARLGSFTSAGREMHLTQGAVSHHVLALERGLGTVLFVRRRGGLELTPPGRLYWEQSLQALQLLKRAAVEVKHADRRRESVTISVPPSFAQHWLAPKIGEFVASNPDITLNLVNRREGQAARLGDEDATVELREGSAAGFAMLRLLSLVYGLYGSPKLLTRSKAGRASRRRSALTNKELRELLVSVPLIRTSLSDAWPGWLRLTKLDKSIPATHLAGGPVYAQASLALLAVISGTGVALLPRHVAEKAITDGSVLKLSRIGWPASKAYHLMWPGGVPATPTLHRFIEWAATVAGTEDEGT